MVGLPARFRAIRWLREKSGGGSVVAIGCTATRIEEESEHDAEQSEQEAAVAPVARGEAEPGGVWVAQLEEQDEAQDLEEGSEQS